MFFFCITLFVANIRTFDEQTSSKDIYNDVIQQNENLDDIIPNTKIQVKCGDELTGEYDQNTGILVITGNGEMYDFENQIPDWRYFTGLGFVVIRDGPTSIGSFAFNGTNLASISISSTVTTIGDSAFQNCKSLTSINILEDSKLVTIGSGSFRVSGLKDVTIPDSVTTIESGAFMSCTSLTCVILGKSVVTIGDYAFASCTELYSISFKGNKDLTDLSIFPFYGIDEDFGYVYVPDTYESESFCSLRISKRNDDGDIAKCRTKPFYYGFTFSYVVQKIVAVVGIIGVVLNIISAFLMCCNYWQEYKVRKLLTSDAGKVRNMRIETIRGIAAEINTVSNKLGECKALMDTLIRNDENNNHEASP
ncbi:leucine-rich repeat domain-containing protein [Histomonas meleagridis]|uniref:leucine-rich repeat domain-containing protein n=1 Tax=Histomonas meleagridis TaxID=135588 RepID=UPI0035597702|nr:leucine-rich repeat domain-containing protein [Histomonas meleagridis]KAH0801888.1 leucine-rich repeat domain-containing protein [Histomonas meleagridis]